MKAKPNDLDLAQREAANRLARGYNAVIRGIEGKNPAKLIEKINEMRVELNQLHNLAQNQLDLDIITERHAKLDLRYGFAPVQRRDA